MTDEQEKSQGLENNEGSIEESSVEIGRRAHLRILKIKDFGAFLDGRNLGEIFLPRRDLEESSKTGDVLDVFIYLDSEDRLIATLRQPKIQAGEFAYLRVLQNTQVGAFLDWGLEKDLLVPFAQQHRALEVGKSYIASLYQDARDGRLVATTKIDRFLIENVDQNQFKRGQAVNLLVSRTTDIGVKVIIENRYWGLINTKDLLRPVRFGQSLTGYIQHIRPDGKISITLNGGHQALDKNSKQVLKYLDFHQGFAGLHDKSDPQLILAELGMSKGAFKKAIGRLLKQKQILLEDSGIRLIQKSVDQSDL